jgi:hypothetical protein
VVSAASAGLLGCGGGTTSGAGSTDSGSVEDGGCVPGASLASLPVPNAPIGDAGVTVAECNHCVVVNCQTQLAGCNADCTCNSAAAGILPCLAAGTKFGECAEPLTKDQVGDELWGCIDPNCSFLCAGIPDGG